MIPLWYANSGEDFKIEKYPHNMMFFTSENIEIKLNSMVFSPLSVIGKGKDILYIAYAGKRIAIEKRQAIQISGYIAGKTKIKPKIMHSSGRCFNNCSKCKRCCG